MVDVSFIVPTKNEERWIISCLESIEQNMSKQNISYEILICDDGSTDNTPRLLKAYKSEHTRVFFNATSMRKVSIVRNFLASNARGDILVCIDGDVILDNCWGDVFINLINTVKRERIITGSLYAISENANWLTSTWFKSLNTRSNVNYINAGHLIISRSLFIEIGMFNEILETGEDFDLCQRAKQKGVKIINNCNLVAVHMGFPDNIKWFFNRERWHGKGNWQGRLILSKMTVFITIFWLGLITTILTVSLKPAIISVTVGFLLGLKRCGISKSLPVCILLSLVVLVARGLSLIDVFIGHTSRTKQQMVIQ